MADEVVGEERHRPCAFQPRREFSEESIKELSDSIKEQGVLTPLLVRRNGDGFELIAGERRTLASILAGKEDIPAKILTVKPSSLKISLLQWIENIERTI